MPVFEDALAFFPYGAQYHRAPTPLPEEWDGDLAEIAAKGYTHVQFRPQWRCHERVRGSLVWDDLDRLFDLAAKHRLRVVLKPMLETAPDWVFDELGGTRIGFHGQPISPHANAAFYVGGWWPCFDNPAVRAAASAFTAILVERYRKHPALWMYDAWNEPRSRPLGACQCCHSNAAYRDWLRERFGTIEKLNAHLGKSWTSWDSLKPPAAANDHVEMMLWRTWVAHSVAGQVRMVTDVIHKHHPGSHVLAHVGANRVYQDPACDTSDDLLNAREADRYGMSHAADLSPKCPLTCDQGELYAAWLRRVDARYWVHEFYTNAGGWSRPVAPATLRQLLWIAIAGGTGAITFWQWRSERFGWEADGYGMRNIDGSPTERSRVADDVAGVLSRHGRNLVAARRPASRVKLLYCGDSDLAGRLATMRAGIGDIHLEEASVNYPYKLAFVGMHMLLTGLGHEVDIVVPGDALQDDDILIVEGPEVVKPETATWLSSFVERGGRALVGFPFACLDSRPWVEPQRPAHGLATLLGCREAARLVTDGSTDSATFAGNAIPAYGWRIDLAPAGGTVAANWQDGGVAAVTHRHGRGQVISLGISLGHAMRKRNAWTSPEATALSGLLGQLGLKAPAWSHPQVRVRRRLAADGSSIWFAWSWASETVSLGRIPELAAATGVETWDASGAELRDGVLTLQRGGVWVARVPAAG